jgi:HD-like signal output (HDOD) protein
MSQPRIPTGASPSAPRAHTPQEVCERLRTEIRAARFNLPVPPRTAAQVLQACRREQSGARDVAEIMHRDPPLAAHVLRLANSVVYAGHGDIVTLPQAIARLGLGTVAELATAAVLRSSLGVSPRYMAVVEDVWRHSCVAAGWAREVARHRRCNVEGAFLAGLMHEIGRPLVLQAIAELENAAGHLLEAAVVDEVADTLHAEAGAALTAAWSLPEWIGVAIAWHHDPEHAPEPRDLTRTVAMADRLASWTLSRPRPGIDALIGDAVALSLNLYAEDLEALAERLDGVLATAEVVA